MSDWYLPIQPLRLSPPGNLSGLGKEIKLISDPSACIYFRYNSYKYNQLQLYFKTHVIIIILQT